MGAGRKDMIPVEPNHQKRRANAKVLLFLSFHDCISFGRKDQIDMAVSPRASNVLPFWAGIGKFFLRCVDECNANRARKIQPSRNKPLFEAFKSIRPTKSPVHVPERTLMSLNPSKSTASRPQAGGQPRKGIAYLLNSNSGNQSFQNILPCFRLALDCKSSKRKARNKALSKGLSCPARSA